MPAAAHAQTPKPTCILTATPSAVQQGGSFTLKWNSQNATAGAIVGIGNVSLPSGQKNLIPVRTTVYTGSFSGPGGTTNCSVTVTIIPPTGFGGGEGTSGGGSGEVSAGIPIAPTPNPGINVPTAEPSGSIGRLVPCDGVNCQLCHVAKLTQNIINFLMGLSIPLAIGLLAWAGVLFFSFGGSPVMRAKAKLIIWNLGMGFVFIVAAFLGIQTVLKVVLAPQYYQSWTSIQCVAPESRETSATISKLLSSLPGLNILKETAGRLSSGYQTPGSFDERFNGGGSFTDDMLNVYNTQTVSRSGGSLCPTGYDYVEDENEYWCANPGNPDDIRTAYAERGISNGPRGVAICDDYNPTCNTSFLTQLGLPQHEAVAMSCVAMTENAGRAVGCSGTGPCGTFQITKTNWNTYAPAGCRASDFGGNIVAAQNNAQCNARTMVAMVNEEGYEPWTGLCNTPGGCNVGTKHEIAYGQPWNSAARRCIQNYDPDNL